MIFPSHDANWQAVADLLRQRMRRSDSLLAPDLFRAVFINARRYSDSYFDPSARYDWVVVHKDEMALMRRSFLAALLDATVPVYANEVFVVLAEAAQGPGLDADDPHVGAFLKRRATLLGRNQKAHGAHQDDPSRWFAPAEELDDALRFLDGKIRAEWEDGDGTASTDAAAPKPGGSCAAGIPPLQIAPTCPAAMAGTVHHPIGNIRRMLEDTRIRGFQPRGLVDVGANIGEWTRLALSALVADRADCHYIAAGAGRAAGEAIQTISEDPGASSFLPTPEAAWQASGRQRPTAIVTIDDLFRPGGQCTGVPPDLVKIDVQGFEMEVLAGAGTLFGRTELFIIETSLYEFMPRQPLAREVIAVMASRGYEIYDIPEFGRRPYDGALRGVAVDQRLVSVSCP
jgi:FkbM family methyltransferase